MIIHRPASTGKIKFSKENTKMLSMKEIVNYGPCYISAINCPADGIDLPRKATLFDVCKDGTHQTLDTFRTAKAAKKFAHRYVSDPVGTMQKQRQLSGDRLAHVRALWAVSLLSSWTEYNLTITDKRNPYEEPEQYEVANLFVTAAENQIVVLYYPDSEATSVEYLYFSGIKTVRAIAENTFAFETYTGKVYTISGKN